MVWAKFGNNRKNNPNDFADIYQKTLKLGNGTGLDDLNSFWLVNVFIYSREPLWSLFSHIKN